MSFKAVITSLNEKGQPLIDVGKDLYRLINQHGTYYDELHAIAGVPLDQLTNTQINNYFGIELPAESMTAVKTILLVLESVMANERDLINTLPPNDVG